MRRGIVVVAVPLVIFAIAGSVRADLIDRRAAELRTGDPFKVRLSAALWLSRRPPSDGRAVSLLAEALGRDKESVVRRVAAHALGDLVKAETPDRARTQALAALTRSAASDPDREVKSNAKKALAKVRAAVPPSPSPATRGGVFVVISAPSDRSGKLPDKGVAALESAVRRTFAPEQSWMKLSIAGDPLPGRRDLERAGRRGFIVATSVVVLESKRQGGAVEVTCRVSLEVTPWTGVDGAERWVAEMTATATGGGKVSGPAKAEGRAILDCVTAVAEEVARRQVVGFVRRAGSAP